MQEVDVIICGAGPAGSTCALGLFDAGLNVVLLDKHKFPREKICGDAHNITVYKILNTISPIFASAFQELKSGTKTDKIKLVSPKGRIYTVKLKEGFHSLPRAALDNFLLEMVRKHTRTTILENTTVTNVTIEKDYVLATTANGKSLKAKVIIGCDGAHSIVQSALTNTRESLTEVWPSVRAYFKNVKGIEPDQLEIYYLNELPQGYFWIFPSPGGLANVGLGTSKSVIVKNKINIRKVFQEILKQPEFASRFDKAEMVGELKGWSLPMGYFEGKLPISGNRVLLCGDAAALIDPATGEGISPAISSGRHAAQVVKKCFARDDFSATSMKDYDKKVFKKYYRSYTIRTMVSNLTFNIPFLLDAFLWIAQLFNRNSNKLANDKEVINSML
jgi:geranylgeranyl reductase family protein